MGSSAVGRRQLRREAGEDVGEVVADHRGAGARGDDDVLGVAEDFEEVPGDGAGFFAIAAVEGGLAAAGLVFRKVDGAAGALQHIGHRHPNFRKKLVDDAGDK